MTVYSRYLRFRYFEFRFQSFITTSRCPKCSRTGSSAWQSRTVRRGICLAWAQVLGLPFPPMERHGLVWCMARKCGTFILRARAHPFTAALQSLDSVSQWAGLTLPSLRSLPFAPPLPVQTSLSSQRRIISADRVPANSWGYHVRACRMVSPDHQYWGAIGVRP